MASLNSGYVTLCGTITLAIMLSGCMSSTNAPALDAIATGSIAPSMSSKNETKEQNEQVAFEDLEILSLTEEQALDDEMSDQRAILDAMQNIEANRLQGAPVKWQNDVTGSTGFIASLIQQPKGEGQKCRDFEVLRTSFNGVVLYNASACSNASNVWVMERFAAVQAEG